jgi:anti-sigma regulatory factor (Ser/Thr protein kinase)
MEISHHRVPFSHSVLNLDGERGTVHAARDHTREFLDELNPPVTPTTTVDILMLVSELVTNAVRHAPGPCSLYLVYAIPDGPDHPELTVAVSDTSASSPTPRVPDMLAGTGGLGWHMVRRLTTFVGIHRIPSRGKTIETTLAAIAP